LGRTTTQVQEEEADLDYATFSSAVEEHAALRRRQILQPVGGKGDKILPPTYPPSDEMKRLLGERSAPPRHIFERRRIDGGEIWCVLVDSVQSQANRLEEALLAAIREGAIAVPYVTVDFTGKEELSGLTEITSLDAPHRIYDAILRDSLLDGEPFMKSLLGLRLAKAKPADATALLEASPTALLLGAWHSTGEGGGLGAKFPRCLVSEIVAIDTPVDPIAVPRTGEVEPRTSGRRTASRIDPLGVLRKVKVFKSSEGWDVVEEHAGRGAKVVRPSEINHGNIAPSVQPLGVTCEYVEHIAVISFAGLRRLAFGGRPRDRAGRALLAALGLVALTEQDARGYALRSRCDLVCEGRAPLEVVQADGSVDRVEIDRAGALRLYSEAFDAACVVGFSLSAEPVRLVPQDKLVEIVRRSQRFALEGEGGEADEPK
jgi:CRISPR-associated protein Csb1